jgi:hypothetical protein
MVSSAPTVEAATGGTLPIGDPKAPMPAPNTCHIGSKNGQDIPDPKCTPGATNPAVTQATIATTICQSGWTSTVRPPVSVTSRMKKLSAESYGIVGVAGEFDHLVSLEVGGAPDDPRNLWVEPGSIPNPKDAVENQLKAAVCAGLVPLATAQHAIATSWPTAFDDAGLRVSGGKVCLRGDPARCVK